MWEFNNDKPVYIQIIEEIKTKIISGEYKAGQRIPSVRELAQEAKVNPNTMQKALFEIEREGYIFSMRTSGKYITEDLNKIKNLKSQTAEKEINDFIRKMVKLGFEENEIQIIIAEYCQKHQQ